MPILGTSTPPTTRSVQPASATTAGPASRRATPTECGSSTSNAFWCDGDAMVRRNRGLCWAKASEHRAPSVPPRTRSCRRAVSELCSHGATTTSRRSHRVRSSSMVARSSSSTARGFSTTIRRKPRRASSVSTATRTAGGVHTCATVSAGSSRSAARASERVTTVPGGSPSGGAAGSQATNGRSSTRSGYADLARVSTGRCSPAPARPRPMTSVRTVSSPVVEGYSRNSGPSGRFRAAWAVSSGPVWRY